MEIDKAELWEEIADNMSGAEFMDDYSGRGMFGKTCPAVTFEMKNDDVEFAVRVTASVYEQGGNLSDALKLIPQRYDAMGLGTVVY